MTQTKQVITKRMAQRKGTIIQGTKGRLKVSDIPSVEIIEPKKVAEVKPDLPKKTIKKTRKTKKSGK